ncbi:adenosine deaminase [Anianabacter salinae]|uniref:adenosine deaminase n=1 Tax=Anianabacter salinae TaxID=2851023 RepID=UPI00225DEE4A|nr:adenosine deaminase [Anianabacter salinae]MBV0911344.1 adenosine deaminase [Anianabacter salinae]
MSHRATPKVELHLHLEGAAPPRLIADMAKERGINLNGVFAEDGSYAYRDFWHFLEVYEAATSVLTSPEDYQRLTRAVLAESAAQGVIYTEAFLSPDFCGGRDVGAWKEYLHAIREAAEAAERQDGITMRGIVTCIRHFGPDKARETARCAAETMGDFLTGFGIAGDEKSGQARDFDYAFDMAREAGLRLTAHAGEWRGPKGIVATLDHLKPERLGHGVRAIEDPELVDRIAAEGIVLEVCPGSNVTLGVYPDWQRHPVQLLREAGVKVTVSTDDPPFFHTTMTREFDMLADTFGWEDADFLDLNRTAMNAAFCDETTRAAKLKILEGAA